MKNKHTPDVFFNLFRFSIATIVFFSTANFADFANKRIRFAHSLASPRVYEIIILRPADKDLRSKATSA